jgi:hypothetical protein
MKSRIKNIVKEYREHIQEIGGYDDEDSMKLHYSGLMSDMASAGESIYSEYVNLVDNVLPEILDESISKELVDNLEKLKQFMISYDKFLEKTHNKNIKRFTKKGS